MRFHRISMDDFDLRSLGKILVLIGILLLLATPFYPLVYWNLFLGFVVAIAGIANYRRHREPHLFVTKAGEPIHSAFVWKKGPEPGLFITRCERLVSIDSLSIGTAHVGYRIVTAEHATCNECKEKERKAIAEEV
ncbi:MAG: hypothetical protein ACFFEF_10300 [Candidatus Thorarchaeota archaeon]